uniref:Uncharacterized protein n=1 Tax=Pithovirus LCPAC304 TaxID=2506594 RepID=A0A481ZAA9_9VIRU|nr:MAG: hypothetical protein LCPAC304_06390 [Pithovirus LCPAC304]
MKNYCQGDGTCFMQDWESDDFISVKDPEISCEYGCTLKECPNIVVCESNPVPEWCFNCHGGVCVECNMYFGTWLTGVKNSNILQIRDALEDEECLRCHANKTMYVKHPVYMFCVCVECFKEKWYSADANASVLDEPQKISL